MVDVRVRVSSGLGLCDAAGAISNAYRLVLEGLFKVFEARRIFGTVEKAEEVRTTSSALSRVTISLYYALFPLIGHRGRFVLHNNISMGCG